MIMTTESAAGAGAAIGIDDRFISRLTSPTGLLVAAAYQLLRTAEIHKSFFNRVKIWSVAVLFTSHKNLRGNALICVIDNNHLCKFVHLRAVMPY